MGGEESQLAWIVGQFVVGEEIEGTNELYSTSTFVSSESIPLPFRFPTSILLRFFHGQ